MVAKSFSDIVLPASMQAEMQAHQLCLAILRWALAPNYRAVRTRSGQIMHRRFDGHTVAELEAKVDSFGPLADKVRRLPAYRAALTYLCVDEQRPGVAA